MAAHTANNDYITYEEIFKAKLLRTKNIRVCKIVCRISLTHLQCLTAESKLFIANDFYQDVAYSLFSTRTHRPALKTYAQNETAAKINIMKMTFSI